MKVALVQDWLTEMGGAEKVFQALLEMFPEADVFTLVYKKAILDQLHIPESRTTASFIHKLPFAQKHYRYYLPFFSMAIENLDLSSYDLVISSSSSVAKGVMTRSGQLHICYCHTPVRYAWDLYHQYLRDMGLNRGIKAMLTRYVLHRLRIWDIASLNRVDYFISNSDNIKRRIRKIYNREAVTIYPPVDLSVFDPETNKEDYYVTCSRLVPYKRVDIIVEAFSTLLKDKKLIVVGGGPEYGKIEKLKGANVILMHYQPFDMMKKYISHAKAFIFAADEDFGIAPVEAQACGTPVLAYGKGGALETVADGLSGMYFYAQTAAAIAQCVRRFEQVENEFHAADIAQHALKFSKERFKAQMEAFIKDKLAETPLPSASKGVTFM